MRKIINSTYMTLNGVVEDPQLWPALPRERADDGDAIQIDLLETCDILLMGRRTYDVFAASWPERSGDPISDRMNSMRKVVASTQLSAPTWTNIEVVTTGLTNRLRALKAEDGGDIVQYGFGPVSQLMLEHDLLDELHLWIYPQFVKATSDDLLFRPGLEALFDLRGTHVLANGIVVHTYAVRR